MTYISYNNREYVDFPGLLNHECPIITDKQRDKNIKLIKNACFNAGFNRCINSYECELCDNTIFKCLYCCILTIDIPDNKSNTLYEISPCSCAIDKRYNDDHNTAVYDKCCCYGCYYKYDSIKYFDVPVEYFSEVYDDMFSDASDLFRYINRHNYCVQEQYWKYSYTCCCETETPPDDQRMPSGAEERARLIIPMDEIISIYEEKPGDQNMI